MITAGYVGARQSPACWRVSGSNLTIILLLWKVSKPHSLETLLTCTERPFGPNVCHFNFRKFTSRYLYTFAKFISKAAISLLGQNNRNSIFSHFFLSDVQLGSAACNADATFIHSPSCISLLEATKHCKTMFAFKNRHPQNFLSNIIYANKLCSEVTPT